MSAKYPRTLHLPWSPGGTSDDRRLGSAEGLVGVDIVVTEKCDGSNLAYTRGAVFARSHSGPPSHPSFDMAKATHGAIGHLLSDGISVFCEYCFAVHSIAYEALPGYSMVFAVRDDAKGRWWAWPLVEAQAEALSLPTVPVLFRGVVGSERELEELTCDLASMPSALGGEREGVVVRVAEEIADERFSASVAKWVRRGHVQTSEHWLHQSTRVQPLSGQAWP